MWSLRHFCYFGFSSCRSLDVSITSLSSENRKILTVILPSAMFLLTPFVISPADGDGSGIFGLWPFVSFFRGLFLPSPSFPIPWYFPLDPVRRPLFFTSLLNSRYPWAWLLSFTCSCYLVLFASLLSSRERKQRLLLEGLYSVLATHGRHGTCKQVILNRSFILELSPSSLRMGLSNINSTVGLGLGGPRVYG